MRKQLAAHHLVSRKLLYGVQSGHSIQVRRR